MIWQSLQSFCRRFKKDIYNEQFTLAENMMASMKLNLRKVRIQKQHDWLMNRYNLRYKKMSCLLRFRLTELVTKIGKSPFI